MNCAKQGTNRGNPGLNEEIRLLNRGYFGTTTAIQNAIDFSAKLSRIIRVYQLCFHLDQNRSRENEDLQPVINSYPESFSHSRLFIFLYLELLC